MGEGYRDSPLWRRGGGSEGKGAGTEIPPFGGGGGGGGGVQRFPPFLTCCFPNKVSDGMFTYEYQ